MKYKISTCIIILFFSFQAFSSEPCLKSKQFNYTNPVKNLCEIQINMPACKELDARDLKTCDGTDPTLKTDAWYLIKRCAGDFGNNLVAIKDFIYSLMKSFLKGLYSISSFTGRFSATKKLDQYASSLKLYLGTEYSRLRAKYGTFGAIKHMAAPIGKLMVNTVSDMMTNVSEQYSCMNSDAKKIQLCSTLATVLAPPTAMLGLLKYGPKALLKFKNLKKAFSNKYKKKGNGKTLGEIMKEQKKNTRPKKKTNKKVKTKKEVALNQVVMIPAAGGARYVYAKVTSRGRDNVVVTYIGDDGRPHIKVVKKEHIKKYSGAPNMESKKLDAFNVDPDAPSPKLIKKKVYKKKKAESKKVVDDNRPVKSEDIWKAKTTHNYPKVGSKGKFKRSDGKFVDFEVTAHGRSGFTGIYKNASGEFRMGFIKGAKTKVAAPVKKAATLKK